MRRIKFYRSKPAVLVLLILVTMGIGVSAQSKKDQKKAKDLTDLANKLFNQKNYRDAVDNYGQSIQIVPTNAYAHFWKGYGHFYLKENDKAAEELGIALSQGYKPIDVYKVRWYVYYDQKNFDGALDDIRKGIAIEPNNLTLLKALGEIQYARNDLPGALSAFQRAAVAAPKDGDIYYNMARVQLGLGNSAAQAVAADKAISLGTQLQGEAYYLLGDAYQKQKNVAGAIQAYQRAISAKAQNYQAYRNLADLFRSENRLSEAIDISKRALQYYPNDGYIHTDLSWYYSLADRTPEAIQAAQTAIKILPDQYMAYTNLCRAFNDLRDYAQAITACNNALKLNSKDGETYFYLARAYDLTGRKDDATRNYARAVAGLIEFTKANPEYSDGFYLLGNAYFADNQRDKAIDAYSKCLALSPRFIKAHYNLGIIQVLKKNKAAATEQYNALLGLDPTRASQLKVEIDKM